MKRIVFAPGCGRYYSISPNKKLIGLKLIGRNGKQTPTIYDLSTDKLITLCEPCRQAGQVSFSRGGRIAYTVGKDLMVKKNDFTKRYRLGIYSNLTPISPDGKYVVYGDKKNYLWMFDLKTQTRRCITPGANIAYFKPVWSPDSRSIAYSAINGVIFVFDLDKEKIYEIGEGREPCWSPDGKYLVYYLTETDGHRLTASDLYLSSYDGVHKFRLTNTSTVFEMDPSFIEDKKIVFHTYNKREIRTGEIIDNRLQEVEKIIRAESTAFDYVPTRNNWGGRDSIDVPYLHQVYDTPNWFNGHWACAPTTAMMAIAYYWKLPYWDCWCSDPSGHISHFGRYVCERYFYREINYNLQAQDPSGNWAMGGYGYMWAGSNRPYTHMEPYIENHDITSWRDDSPTWNETVAEVNAGYPYGMCVGLTASGHLVLAVGVAMEGTLICNDPYGNKNTPGYPSYDGKYARYDWPGYNNGYENLNQVYWCVGARGDWEPASDTLVDDLQFASGFYLHTDSLSSMAFWWDDLSGYNGHLWWTYTTAASSEDTCYAIWTPDLPQGGNYEVYAYIPANNATATAARYKIQYANGIDTVTVDQSSHPGEWVLLGEYPFETSGGYVYLGDATGVQGQHIAFDAVRWVFSGHKIEERMESGLGSRVQLGSNLIRGKLQVSINLEQRNQVSFAVYGITGRLLLDEPRSLLEEGSHHLEVDVAQLPAGVFILETKIGEKKFTNKFIKTR